MVSPETDDTTPAKSAASGGLSTRTIVWGSVVALTVVSIVYVSLMPAPPPQQVREERENQIDSYARVACDRMRPTVRAWKERQINAEQYRSEIESARRAAAQSDNALVRMNASDPDGLIGACVNLKLWP